MYLSSHISLNINAQIIHVGESDHPISSDYQFYLVQKGAFTVYLKDNTEKYTLNKNDIIVIEPDEQITCVSNKPNTLISIRIDKSFIKEIIPLNHEFICNSIIDKNNSYEQLANILIQICSAFFSEPDKTLMISLIYELSNLLQNKFMHRIETKEIQDAEKRNQERMNSIVNYLQTHYQQSLSLNSLAKEMFLTPQYLSKFIKKNLGTTFSSYLTDIRMEHAVNELLHTNHSVTDIALNNGFPNIAAFNKIFRQKYNVSPSLYRQGNLDLPTGTPSTNTVDLLEANNPMTKQLEIHVALDDFVEYQKPWQNTINIGPLSNALRNTFHVHLLEYKKYVSVKYIRFFNMFSDDVLMYDEETNAFNFSNLDVILDFFYRQKIVPFVELSYKPAKGYVSVNSITDDNMFENEKPLDYYYMALSAVIKHCLNKYGISYMSQWRFEVWLKSNEDLTALETPYQYSQKYMGFYKIVKNLIPKCSMGGPGFNMSGSYRDFTELIDSLEQHHLPMDFITLCAYSYEIQSHYQLQDLSTIGIISLDTDHIINNYNIYKEYIKTTNLYNASLVFITEFGSTVSVNNHITESVFQAAFLCKNMLGLLPYCSCVAYSYFIDTMRSFTQNTHSFSGLISENGTPKPSLHAYTFLNNLGKNLVSLGSNYIMTCNSANSYQLLCYHYTHFSKSYCFNSWDNIRMENTYDIFEEESPLKTKFAITGLPSGRYKVTQFSLNRNYGSVLDKYLRILDRGNISSTELLSSIMSLREDETNYYKQTAVPRQDIYYLYCNDVLELDITLDSHEIIFYELNRVL